ncbi:S-layer homology domain-containing protein [Candidatus Peregrinibacteria bacterium]|nr:S-layer homology domain-containing protein [Candidatus Peregrinibacteria bacterium]
MDKKILKNGARVIVGFWLMCAVFGGVIFDGAVFGAGQIFNVQSAQAANTLFADVSNDTRYFMSLSYLKNLGVISGYPDMTFKPNNLITRAEFLKLIMMHAGIKNTRPKTILFDPPPQFSDVNPDAWFAKYISDAAKFGIAKGYSDGTFHPTDNVKLAEALKMVYLAHAINVPTINIRENPFPDLFIGHWALPYAKFSWEKNVVLMDSDSKLHPEKNITRAEAAEILYRVQQVSSKLLAPFDLSSEWELYENSSQNFSVRVPWDWQIIPESTRTVLWQKDAINKQPDYEYISPLSAKIVIRSTALADDELKSNVYFEKIKSFSKQVFPTQETKFEETTIGGQSALYIKVPSKNIYNWYVIIKDAKKALIVYAEAGIGGLAEQFEKIIKLSAGSVKYLASNLTPEQQAQIEALIAKISAAVNVEGKSKEIIKEISDAVIFETDSIGIGTGPVDYYYSKKLNLTIKVERTSKTILATRGGKTAKF